MEKFHIKQDKEFASLEHRKKNFEAEGYLFFFEKEYHSNKGSVKITSDYIDGLDLSKLKINISGRNLDSKEYELKKDMKGLFLKFRLEYNPHNVRDIVVPLSKGSLSTNALIFDSLQGDNENLIGNLKEICINSENGNLLLK